MFIEDIGLFSVDSLQLNVILATQVSLLELKKIQYSNINSCRVQQGKEEKKKGREDGREERRVKGWRKMAFLSRFHLPLRKSWKYKTLIKINGVGWGKNKLWKTVWRTQKVSWELLISLSFRFLASWLLARASPVGRLHLPPIPWQRRKDGP